MAFVKLSWEEHIEVTFVLDDGRRVEGWVEAWRDGRDGRECWVRYSTGVGQTYIDWLPADRLTPV